LRTLAEDEALEHLSYPACLTVRLRHIVTGVFEAVDGVRNGATKAGSLDHLKVVYVVADCDGIGELHAQKLRQDGKPRALLDAFWVEFEVAHRGIAHGKLVGEGAEAPLNSIQVGIVWIFVEHLDDFLATEEVERGAVNLLDLHAPFKIAAFIVVEVPHVHRLFGIHMDADVKSLSPFIEQLCALRLEAFEMQQPVSGVFGDGSPVERDRVLTFAVAQRKLLERLLNGAVASPCCRYE